MFQVGTQDSPHPPLGQDEHAPVPLLAEWLEVAGGQELLVELN